MELLGWVLDPVYELHLFEVRGTVRGLDRQLACEGVMQRNVIAKQGIWSERDVIDADQVRDVLEMLHE